MSTRIFVIRARKGATSARKLSTDLGAGDHIEVVAHSVINALYISKGMRRDVVVHVVMESTADYSRTITFDSREELSLTGFHEQAVLDAVSRALEVSQGAGKEELRKVATGLSVETISFERLLKRISEADIQLYVLDKKGSEVREVNWKEDACFILTDHIPMPKKTFNSLRRFGAEKISIGPKMLFAAQCITILNNELDRSNRFPGP